MSFIARIALILWVFHCLHVMDSFKCNTCWPFYIVSQSLLLLAVDILSISNHWKQFKWPTQSFYGCRLHQFTYPHLGQLILVFFTGKWFVWRTGQRCKSVSYNINRLVGRNHVMDEDLKISASQEKHYVNTEQHNPQSLTESKVIWQLPLLNTRHDTSTKYEQ